MLKKRNLSRGWDVAAASLSSLCVLHCLGLPLFVVLLPVASQFGDDHFVHILMVAAAAPVTLWVVLNEMTADRNEVFIACALTGLGLLIAAVAVPTFEPFETPITLAGGGLLATAHIWRWYQHHSVTSVDDNV
ncbi:MAG: MerC domain-containing protein [Pseudomonadota bacterium]